MEIKNRLVIIIFFLINAPILAIIALVISSVITPDNSLLPNNIKQNLNWFSENPDLSHTLVTILYITAGIFLVIAVLNILATAFDSSSDKDSH